MPYSPGGGTDGVARLMADQLPSAFGQSVIVENKPGASGNIGARDVVTSPRRRRTAIRYGHVPLGVDGLGGMGELIGSGKLRPIAVLSPQRPALAPEIPSPGDAGIDGVDGTGYSGALVPADTPAEVVARLHAAFSTALRDAQVRQRLSAIGIEAVGAPSEDLRALLWREREKWTAVIKTPAFRPIESEMAGRPPPARTTRPGCGHGARGARNLSRVGNSAVATGKRPCAETL